MKQKNTLNYPKSAAMGFFSKGLKNEFETAVVNETSVFEPLKFYCTYDKNCLDQDVFPQSILTNKVDGSLSLFTSLSTVFQPYQNDVRG